MAWEPKNVLIKGHLPTVSSMTWIQFLVVEISCSDIWNIDHAPFVLTLVHCYCQGPMIFSCRVLQGTTQIQTVHPLILGQPTPLPTDTHTHSHDTY